MATSLHDRINDIENRLRGYGFYSPEVCLNRALVPSNDGIGWVVGIGQFMQENKILGYGGTIDEAFDAAEEKLDEFLDERDREGG